MIHIITFKWRSPTYSVTYTAEHVNILADMVRRHYQGPHRFLCITDDPRGIEVETYPLWGDCSQLKNASGAHLPSCYRRLKLFDPETQAELGIKPGDRLVQIDLDTVICGSLNPLFDRDDPFVGWAVPGSFHPRVFNGSMWMVRAGAEAHVWRDFNPDTSPQEAKAARFLGSDQSWMSYRLQGRAGWTDSDGVYSYPLLLKRYSEPPENARVIMFHGFQKPWKEGLQPWVQKYWRHSGRGRCLILGYAPTVWIEAEAALETGPFDGVICSPEAAKQWPEEPTGVAYTDSEAERLASVLGFDEIVFCGRSEAREMA